MSGIRVRFDGHVLIPLEPVDLPLDRTLILHVEPVPRPAPGGSSLKPVLVPRDPELTRRLIDGRARDTGDT